MCLALHYFKGKHDSWEQKVASVMHESRHTEQHFARKIFMQLASCLRGNSLGTTSFELQQGGGTELKVVASDEKKSLGEYRLVNVSLHPTVRATDSIRTACKFAHDGSKGIALLLPSGEAGARLEAHLG